MIDSLKVIDLNLIVILERILFYLVKSVIIRATTPIIFILKRMY